jgi:hypothetical protein
VVKSRAIPASRAVPSRLFFASFAMLVIGTAAAAAIERIDSYRLHTIMYAPCTKHVLAVESFESQLWWIALGALFAAVAASFVSLLAARLREGGQVYRGTYVILFVAIILLAFTSVAYFTPFDSSDSSLPTCGVASQRFTL